MERSEAVNLGRSRSLIMSYLNYALPVIHILRYIKTGTVHTQLSDQEEEHSRHGIVMCR